MIAFETHNHGHCQSDQIALLERMSAENGLRLTASRKRVFELLVENHRAMGAYELLEALTKEGVSAQPPVVYRALSFLTDNGFAHKIERLNAYIACAFMDEDHQAAFLICKNCAKVGEACVDMQLIEGSEFQIDAQVIEAEGLCKNCVDSQ